MKENVLFNEEDEILLKELESEIDRIKTTYGKLENRFLQLSDNWRNNRSTILAEMTDDEHSKSDIFYKCIWDLKIRWSNINSSSEESKKLEIDQIRKYGRNNKN